MFVISKWSEKVIIPVPLKNYWEKVLYYPFSQFLQGRYPGLQRRFLAFRQSLRVKLFEFLDWPLVFHTPLIQFVEAQIFSDGAAFTSQGLFRIAEGNLDQNVPLHR
jgi:hypothetical protein